MADPKKALSAWKAKYGIKDEEDEKKKQESSVTSKAPTTSVKEEDEFTSSSSSKARDPKAALSTWKEKYSGDGWKANRETENKTSYLDTARNATKATITTEASKISTQDKDRRRKELETELDDLNDRLRLNQQKQVGAMRGHASNLAKEAAVEYEELTARISEINKELEMLDQPDTISSYDQLTGNLEDAKERQAKAQRAVSQYSGNAGGRALAALPAEEREALYKELNEANAAVAALSRQQEQIDYLNDWQDVTLEKDNFWNQTKANYRVGRITQDTNEAFNTYIMNPTEENKEYAYALEELLAQYQQNNAKILDDEGAKATWISKSAAGYLPQFWDQTKAQVAGGAVGGLIGASVGNPVTGIKVGASAASGLESYGQMRGAAYRSLIAAGVDDETALAAANDEAFISALIEGVGTYASFMTLGGSKALGAIGNAALKSGSKNTAVKAVASLFGKSATDKMAKQAAKEAGKSTLRKGIELLGGLGLEAVSEYAEEASQEGVSIANQNRENTGKWDLAKEAAGVIKDAVTGENEEARSQIHEAGKEGAKISLMFGSVQTTTNTIVSKMANAKTKAERDTVVNEVLNDKESLSALIEEGKASGENSVSAKIAQEIESKVSSGKEVTKDDVRRLIVSNAEYIKAENAEQATEAPQSAQERTMSTEAETPAITRNVQQAQASEAAAGKQSVPYNVMSRSDTTRKGATAPGYGEVGTRTFAEIVEESGRSADEVRAQFQTSYELGKLEMPREKVRFESTIQESAYNAGRQDAILSMKKAESKGATVWGKEGGLIQNEYSAKLSKQTADTLQKIGKATGTKIVFDAQVGGGDANGAYVDSQGTIHIAADAKNPVMVVVKHELTHRLQSLAPKEYTQFRNYAVQVMSEGRWGMYNSNTAVEAQQEKYYQLSKGRVNLTAEQAMDEIAADFTERILTDEKALNDFVSHVTKSEEHRTMGQKFFQTVREFIDKVKRIFKGDEAKMDEAAKEEYGVTIEQLEKAEQLWKEAYRAATERAQSATKNTAQVDGEVQYSINESFASDINEWNREGRPNGERFVLGSTGPVLQGLGAIESDIYMMGDKIKTILADHPEMTLSEIKKIPQMLEDPVLIIGSKGRGKSKSNSRLVIFGTIRAQNGQPVMSVLDLRPVENHLVVDDMQKVNSAYTKDNPAGFISSSEVLHADKKRTIPLLRTMGLQLRPIDLQRSGSVGSITYKGDFVNIQGIPFSAVVGETQTEAEEFSDMLTQFSLREKDPPKKVGIAYKVFYAKDGQLYPPMVANPGGAGTPVGVWLDADVAASAAPSKTGRPQVQAGGKGTNAGKMSLAFRPGWHLGDLPMATQFARKNPETGVKDLFPADFVWAECEYAMDHDYQEEAMSYGYTENGKFRHSYAGLPRLPEDGYYRYRTNPNPDTVPWVITGAMRVKRILTDTETDKILRDAGVEPMKRQGGELNLEKLGLKAGEQFSLKDQDYMTAVENGDMETAQKMVDEAARAAGYTVEGYHGTGNEKFNSFKHGSNGIYMTSDEEVAKTYGDKVMRLFGTESNQLVVDAGGRYYTNIPIPEWLAEEIDSLPLLKGKRNTDAIAVAAKRLGYSSVKIANVNDSFSAASATQRIADDYVYFESLDRLRFKNSQVKSADPVTYDDNGNVIPLSERFNSKNDDIRYSMKDSTGKELTKEQAEYFKDSKVRDEQGNLKVMYHGTEHGGFHTFDGRHSDDGTSLFFVDSLAVAASYSGSGEVYTARTFNTPKDMNRFLAEIGYEDYEVVGAKGKYTLYYDTDDVIATSDSLRGLYEEFCNFAGVGEGEVNYKVYLNLTNPLEVDAKGKGWNNLSGWSKAAYLRAEDVTVKQVGDEFRLFKNGQEVENASIAVNQHTQNMDEETLKSVMIGKANNILSITTEGNATTREISKWAKEHGYDGVIFKNIHDNGVYSSGREGASTVAIAFDSNQIKSAANENPTEDPDIRFSLKEDADLQRENAKLKEVNAALREQFKTTKFAKVDPKELGKFARKLLKDYTSETDLDEVLSDLDKLYTYLANGEDGNTPAWDTAYRMAYKIAENVIRDASVLNDDMYTEYADLRHRLRTRGISLSKEYEHDIPGYEDLNDFRKRNFGRIKITKDGLDVNTAYQELASNYPGLFDEYTYSHPADQLAHIVEVLESMEPIEENPFSYNMREATTWLANDIMERFFELPQAKPTFADKAQRKVTEQVIKDSKKLERVREQNRERVSKIIAEYREKVKDTRQKEKAAKWEAVGKVKEHYKAKEAKMSESRKAAVLRERISRHAADLKQKLLRPTDKKHIPQDLQGAVAKLLESINQESAYEYEFGKDALYHRVKRGTVPFAEPTKRTKAFAELQAVYAQLANELTVDPDLLGDDGLLNDVIKMADKPLADMTSDELRIVWDTLRAIEASVRTANKIHNAARWFTVEEAANALLEDNGEKKEKTELRGPFNILGWAQSMTGLNMETPETFFHMLGNAGGNLFRMMRNAQDQHIRLMKEVADFTHETLGNVNVRKLENEMHDVTLGGEKVKLSTAQIMELYVLSKRQQAIDHIFVGGILPDVVATKGLKKITKAKPVREITLEEVGKVVNKLTEEQRTLADKLQTYASTTLGKWGNDTSLKVYGYEKFGEKNYWPIRVNRQEVKSDVQKDTAVTSLANRSFTKGTKPHANNSLRLGSIFDTFSTHSSEMATYSAWLGTLEDINRIRNYTFRDEAGHAEDTVKSIIETVHGTSGNTYLDKLIADVTNGVKGTHGETAYMSGLVGNFKAAAVGANLRVIIQQPTAMLRAMDMIGAQHMATVGNPLNGWKKALKYAPIAQWKDWGYFDINTGRQMKDVLFDSDTLLDKTKRLSMWGAGAMDSVSWGHLWNAVESETKAKHEELKPGTDAFYKAVAERFTEIVDHTQVVDGILQRSQIMRSADGIAKMATSFMGEPTKQYNMMMQAAYDAKSTRGKDRKAAMKKLARTAAVLAISGVANAMAQSIIDAIRDDDKEKDYWEKLFASFKENASSTFNPVSYVPFLKDFLSLIQGYDVNRMDMEGIGKVVSAGQNMYKALNGEGKHTVHGAAINLISEIAALVGVPATNLKREIVTFAMHAAIESDNYLMQYRMEKWALNMNNSTNRSTFTNILYKAYKNDKEAFEIIYADMLEEDKFRRVNDEGEVTTTADYIASALNGRVIDDLFALYKSDQTAYKEMYNDLVKRDFLRKGDKSTADIINDAMETRMKKDQGVDGVTDLEQRYYSPADQIRYDNIMGSVQKSGLWSAATEKQRDHLRGDIHEYLTGDSKAAQEMVEDMNDAKNYGIDETEYLLWNLALEMYDTPSDSGEYGSYNTREKADAIAAMTTLSDKEKAYLWSTKTTSDEVWDAFDAGVDIGDYVDFKAALSELEAGVDYKKGDTKSRKRAVNNLLDALGITGADRTWLYHTEYKK